VKKGSRIKRYMKRKPQMPSVSVTALAREISYVLGLNTEDPQHLMNAGELVEGKNVFVAVRSGFTTTDGYERYDGRAKPSDASFWTLYFDTGSEEIAVDSVVTGATSGATGVVVVVGVVVTGFYAIGSAEGYLILSAVSGTFQSGENLQVAAATKCVSTDTANEKDATDATLYDTYIQAAIEYYRNLIQVVPGDGAVLGVHIYNGVRYAFRDDSGVGKMYKNSATGWTVVALGTHLKFHTAGTGAFEEGDTVTGGTSAATGVVMRTAVYEGSYAASSGKGILALASITGTFQNDEDLNTSYDDIATADGTVSGGKLGFDSGGLSEKILAIAIGDKVTGGTSAATGTVTAVTVDTGDWHDANAAGSITMSGISGTFQDNEALNISVDAMAKCDGTQVANTLGANGRYEAINHNFYALERTFRMYACNGVGLAFEFDGTTLCPIKTRPRDDDYPTHIQRHSFYILLGYADGRMANSSLGQPLVFNAILGALETGVGDQITGMISQNKSTTVIYSRNRYHILTGEVTTIFVLDSYDDGVGAQEWSAQRVGVPWAFDDRGISNVSATDVYGNFLHSTMSEKVQSFIKDKTGLVQCSMKDRSRGLYRLFFSDKSGLTLTFWRGQVRGIVPFELSHQAYCAASEEDSNGKEVLLLGGDDGYVYELNKGTSFDDQARECFAVTNHSNYGYPGNKKKFRVAHVKVRSEGKSSVQVGAIYTYEDPDVPQQDLVSSTVYGGPGGRWNNANWNEFNWGASFVGRIRRKLGHRGETCALMYYSSSKYDSNYTIEGHTMHFTPRNRLR